VKLNFIADNLWYSDSILKKAPLVFCIRMTVVKLPSGGLWLHSPIPIDNDLSDEISEVGNVEHIVAPNCFHHMFASEAKFLYPDAKLWAAPGLRKKREDIDFDGVVSEEETEWEGTLEYEFIRGMPWINEVVFFHKPSATLICSDFVFNIREEKNLFMKLLWFLAGTLGKLGQGREWRWLIKDKDKAADSVKRILSWEFERIIMAHGEIESCDNKELL